MKLLMPAFAALLVAVSGCGSKSSETSGVSPEVIRDAVGGLIPGWENGILPKAHWPESIQKLNPLRVYADRVNCVIALSRQGEVESGYYVYVSISSYLPSDDAEWSFSTIGEDVWTYKRKLGEQGVADQPAAAVK